MTVHTLAVPRPLDLAMTLGPLRRGVIDPTMTIDGTEVWRTTRTAEGAATMHIVVRGGTLQAEGWGPGADSTTC